MQSDERVNAALSALRPQIALFRYVISGSHERARNTLISESGPNQARVTLGDFAAGRIDADRFAMVSAGAPPLDTIARAVVERAAEALESLLKAGDELFVVDVKDGMRAGDAIRARLAHLGSAFAVSALVELVRQRTYDSALHALPIAGHPFEKWTTGERMLAPPLIVLARGPNVDVFDLAPLMDGCVRIVLVFNEECAPAPLVRLISPGTFVAQTRDTAILEKFTDYDGPAVVALLKGSEAHFVHDPRAGGAMWQRMRVTSMPNTTPRKSLGSRSAWQQRDDLALLKSFVEPPSLTPSSGRSATSANSASINPVERLTAWLIEQSQRDGVA